MTSPEPVARVVAQAEALGHDMKRDVVTSWAERWTCKTCFLAAWDMVDHFDGAALEQPCEALNEQRPQPSRLRYWARHTMFVAESPSLAAQTAALVVDAAFWRWDKLRDRITRREPRRG